MDDDTRATERYHGLCILPSPRRRSWAEWSANVRQPSTSRHDYNRHLAGAGAGCDQWEAEDGRWEDTTEKEKETERRSARERTIRKEKESLPAPPTTAVSRRGRVLRDRGPHRLSSSQWIVRARRGETPKTSSNHDSLGNDYWAWR
jgi:hypothetical protein